MIYSVIPVHFSTLEQEINIFKHYYILSIIWIVPSNWLFIFSNVSFMSGRPVNAQTTARHNATCGCNYVFNDLVLFHF